MGSDLLHVDDGGHTGFDLDFIQLPAGVPIVFENIGPIAISVSFLCGRWRGNTALKAYYSSCKNDLNQNLQLEEALLKIATVDCIVFIHEEWPRVFQHDIFHHSVMNPSLHPARSSVAYNSRRESLLTGCHPSSTRQGRENSHKCHEQIHTTVCHQV
jgi:hypothetical protein